MSEHSGDHIPPAPGPEATGQSTVPVSPGWNMMAVLALVFAFVFAPLGIVFGFIGRNQIKQTGEQGKGMALAGIILGAVFLVLSLLLFVAALSIPFLLKGKVSDMSDGAVSQLSGLTSGELLEATSGLTSVAVSVEIAQQSGTLPGVGEIEGPASLPGSPDRATGVADIPADYRVYYDTPRGKFCIDMLVQSGGRWHMTAPGWITKEGPCPQL